MIILGAITRGEVDKLITLYDKPIMTNFTENPKGILILVYSNNISVDLDIRETISQEDFINSKVLLKYDKNYIVRDEPVIRRRVTAIDNWKPTINFVLGTCGGVAENLHILDVVIANKTVQYDCIVKMGKERSLFYEPLVTLIDNSWIDFNAFSDKVYEGIIATADQDLNLESLEKLIKENVLCADWESGAIAFICALNNVECCIVRGITNIPVIKDENSDVNQGIDYRVNTPKVMEKLLKSILPKLISSFI
ncbi:5'-methylthioadenosine/S-adenosylhomocysteine nucleosidase [Clostridium sp. FP1]|uniref:5'-methylthioadenosine/S-adenosylhomocysteine nucleosidase n=1 Tax=Clostridium sp. FP1 TaxID=2724076 RepID=UPI0013E94F66|nr:5'-methylthioadenosine/S-adenosylhomocysteine nucleosidase [Clostridium sp. FP1]MBZ9635232.1 hypothetical protein [Clostridium sp. FP1]